MSSAFCAPACTAPTLAETSLAGVLSRRGLPPSHFVGWNMIECHADDGGDDGERGESIRIYATILL